ncbi:hypothetical protein cand_021230 [Cryptosporidium andersoni]|uniref:Uncharacterized protein n=1 Tax=Cryptosporidium andersoni TaxID=117008 RepID=A0A1J4MW45_9CRYT|nr:hypothetical protein cand_021230 [Cryptosporidium andersoni]
MKIRNIYISSVYILYLVYKYPNYEIKQTNILLPQKISSHINYNTLIPNQYIFNLLEISTFKYSFVELKRRYRDYRDRRKKKHRKIKKVKGKEEEKERKEEEKERKEEEKERKEEEKERKKEGKEEEKEGKEKEKEGKERRKDRREKKMKRGKKDRRGKKMKRGKKEKKEKRTRTKQENDKTRERVIKRLGLLRKHNADSIPSIYDLHSQVLSLSHNNDELQSQVEKLQKEVEVLRSSSVPLTQGIGGERVGVGEGVKEEGEEEEEEEKDITNLSKETKPEENIKGLIGSQ